jgi:UDP-2,3-diacylglucosamine pyrophosphatase LpxH
MDVQYMHLCISASRNERVGANVPVVSYGGIVAGHVHHPEKEKPANQWRV